MKSRTILLLSIMLTLASCRDNKSQEQASNETEISNEEQKQPDAEAPVDFQLESVNDTLALQIKDYLNNSFLKPEDKNTIAENDRRFHLYQIDLNEDAKKEIFVYLNSPYFCGTGGCTILLLSPELKPITKFTVTRPPFFIEPTVKNGWKIISLKSENEWKELDFKNGSYPSNPSILEKASYDAPSGHAQIVFDEGSQLKTYNF